VAIAAPPKAATAADPARVEPERRQGSAGTENGREHEGGADLHDRFCDRVARYEIGDGVEHVAEEISDAAADVGEEVVAVRVGEGERVVADIGIAVPALRVQRVGHRRIGAGETRQDGIIDPAVQMNEAGNREFLLAGEAARSLAGDAPAGSSVQFGLRRLPQAS